MCVCLHCTKDAPGYYLCVCSCVQVYIGLSFPSLLLSLYHHHHHPRKGHNRKCPPLAVNNWGRGCCSFMGWHLFIPWGTWIKAPFRCEFFLFLVTVALSFVFGKNCPIMDYLGLKDSSRQLRANCAISYSFYLHLMLHACAARFDVDGES